MSIVMIPASIAPALTALLAGVNAAYPIATATVTTLAGLQQQAHNVSVAINSALFANDPLIKPPIFADPISFAAEVIELATAANDDTKLAELAALAGRAGINLSNAGV